MSRTIALFTVLFLGVLATAPSPRLVNVDKAAGRVLNKAGGRDLVRAEGRVLDKAGGRVLDKAGGCGTMPLSTTMLASRKRSLIPSLRIMVVLFNCQTPLSNLVRGRSC